ncbi:hypothetical protein PAS25_24335 [Leclercia adecarboxylata]|uniref:hypothetical protein n=1 Tax=Leclercia adecarboxylata TaxID=83655 RepID=UPI001118DCB8|nr:hypothetical protein [Leclercia adecarboxylata]QCZ29672.1 hypothetical protein FHN83_24835 [Leclercia adecarboxylata]
MSARERFFKKVQHNSASVSPGKNSVEAEVRVFCSRMNDLARQLSQWFSGSTIEVTFSTKHIHDLSTVGYSLSSGICRYDITTIRLQNGDRSVTILPEQLCHSTETGLVTMRVEAYGITQVFYLSMAPDTGWFIRREHQSAKDNVIMTEEHFFEAVDRLA